MKYRPEFPERFGSVQDARSFCQVFFPWYNTDHHHSGIGLLTPEVLHYGRADDVIRQRQAVLSQAYQRNPERFVRAHPRPPQRPTAVWINPCGPPTSRGRQGVGGSAIEAQNIASHSSLEMTNHCTFIEIDRQDQLTRAIQERLASVGKKKDGTAPAPPQLVAASESRPNGTGGFVNGKGQGEPGITTGRIN